jgi:hypothetical protein
MDIESKQTWFGRDSIARRSSAFRADAARESICSSRCAVAINRPSIAWGICDKADDLPGWTVRLPNLV